MDVLTYDEKTLSAILRICSRYDPETVTEYQAERVVGQHSEDASRMTVCGWNPEHVGGIYTGVNMSVPLRRHSFWVQTPS